MATSKPMNIKEYADREMLVIDVANILAGDLKTALLTQDHVTFVVPGGTTPGPIFDVLCAADLDWSRVKIMLSDERWVPSDHARSNTRNCCANACWSNAPAAAQFLPLYVDEMTRRMGPQLCLRRLQIRCRSRFWCWAWARICTPRRCFRMRTGLRRRWRMMRTCCAQFRRKGRSLASP